jgi:hypothetical protein
MSRRDRGRKGRAGGERTATPPAMPGPGARASHAGWSGVTLPDILLWAAIAIAVTGVWRWSISADGAPITGPGFASALRLMCGSLAFWLIGRAVIRLVLLWCRSADAHAVMHGLPVQLCAVAVGQLGAVCWLVLRSGVHEACVRWTGIPIPVTGIEVFVLMLVALGSLALEWRPSGPGAEGPTGAPWRNRLVQMASFGLLIALVCLAVGFREMPRISALSSDPDNHAFWARMVMRLGVIPWDQGVLGQGPFGYPCGYAALNASWCTLSGISVVDAVTIQPVLQTLMGCLVISALAPWCITHTRSRLIAAPGSQVLLIALLLMTVYWLALPYGMQRDRYFGEGAARLSATMFTALMLMCWLAPLGAPLCSRERILRLGVVSASLAAVLLINPITAAVAAVPALAVGLDECRRIAMRSRLPAGATIPLASVVVSLAGFAALVASDPYFGERIAGRRETDPALIASEFEATDPRAQGSQTMFELPDTTIVPLLSPTQLVAYSRAGIASPASVSAAWGLALVASFVAWISRSPARALRWLAIFPVLAITHFVALCIPPRVGGAIPIYLIQPYTIDAANQMGAVAALCALGVAFAFIVQLSHAWQRAAVAMGAIGLAWIGQSSAASAGNGFIMRPRVTRLDGNMGVPTASDLDVIRFWNQYATEAMTQAGAASYGEAPKILVLGNPRDRGIEQWVFPVGGGRLLPLESPMPVAFFYGHGSGDWNYQSYLDRVCRNFDVDWLLARNVRYVFIPEDERACIAVGERDPNGPFKTLYRSGSAALLQIGAAAD